MSECCRLRLSTLELLSRKRQKQETSVNTEWRSRYDVWSGALVTTYTGDGLGVTMGASYSDVLRWLPAMRP